MPGISVSKICVPFGGGGIDWSSYWTQQYADVLTYMTEQGITHPSPDDKIIQARLVKKLVDGGYWAKAKLVNIYAAAEIHTLIDWAKPGVHVPHKIGTLTFTAYEGYGAAYYSNNAMGLDFNLAVDGDGITQDSICLMYGSQTNAQGVSHDVGSNDATNDMRMNARGTDDFATALINDSTALVLYNNNSKAHYAISRNGTSKYLYRNKTNTGATVASVGIPNIENYACAANANGGTIRCSGRVLSYVMYFTYLTQAEIYAVMDIMEEYLDSYGKGLFVNDNSRTLSGAYQREGIVIEAATVDENHWVGEPNVLYTTTDSVIVGNPCFQMWYSGEDAAAKCYYAESKDGLSWTKYTSNPIVSGNRNYVIKEAGYYYLFTHAGTGLSVYKSTSIDDPVNFAVFADNIIPPSVTGGDWDYGEYPQNICVYKDGGVFYLLYELDDANDNVYKIGLATSNDLTTWTKYASNPVLNNGAGSVSGPFLHKHSNGKWYLWTHNAASGKLPTDIAKYVSDDLHTFTLLNGSELLRLEVWDGPNVRVGQVDDFTAVEVGGKVYCYYGSCPTQTPTTTKKIKCAIVNDTLDNLSLVV